MHACREVGGSSSSSTAPGRGSNSASRCFCTRMEAKRIARQNTTHFTWVLNNTRGSALLATMLHTAVNVWTDIYHPDHADALFSWLGCGVIRLASLIVAVIYGPGRLARKPTVAQPLERGDGPPVTVFT